MNLKVIAAFTVAATFWFHNGSLVHAQDRSNYYAPIDCDFGVTIECIDVGEARLLRTEDGVSVNIVTTDLLQSHAYTVWWVIFNDPSACSDPGCGEDDLEDPDVNATVMWGTGDVAAARLRRGGVPEDEGSFDEFFHIRKSVGHFTAHLNEGELPKVPFGLPGDDDGLIDAMVAEIHTVVRSHGPALTDVVNEQITSFDGGCKVDVAPDIPLRRGECADVQFSIHEP